MSLDAAGYMELVSCAHAIAENKQADISFQRLEREWDKEMEIVAALAKRVEDFSHQQRTVRFCDPVLFAAPWLSTAIRLVACAYDTPEGVVLELQQDMVLFFVAPYPSGFRWNYPRATATEIAARRRAAIQQAAEQRIREQAHEDIEAFVASMATAARSLIDVRIPDAETQQKLHARLSAEQAPGLVEIAQACVAMDMTLTELSYQLPPLDPAQD